VSEQLPPPETAPPAEPEKPGLGGRLQEGRRSFQPGLWVRLIVLAAAVVYLILFVVLNAKTVKVRWVFATTRVSLIWVIVLSLLLGIVLGVLASQLRHFRSRRRRASP
jgi:uncharacterized integral membrane protein